MNLPYSKDVKLLVYDINGHLLVNDDHIGLEKGIQVLEINTEELISGMYIIRVSIDDSIITKKIIKK